MEEYQDLIYKTDTSLVEVEPKDGTAYTLDELQGIVGGEIEIIAGDESAMVVCKDAAESEPNYLATIWVRGNSTYKGFIYGNAIVCGKSKLAKV